MLTIKVHYGYREEEDGDYTKLYFDAPAHYAVCWRCDGHGTHDHPAFANGISTETMYREWDEEQREMYFNGACDVRCTECNGQRVVLEYDAIALPDDVKAGVDEMAADARYDAAMRRAENGRYGY